MTGHHRSGYAVMASRRLAFAVLITALTFATCETAQESAEALNRKIRAAFSTKSKDAATTGTTASARGEAVHDAGMHGSTRHVMQSSATPSPPGDVGSASTTSSNSNTLQGESSEQKTAGRIIMIIMAAYWQHLVNNHYALFNALAPPPFTCLNPSLLLLFDFLPVAGSVHLLSHVCG